MTSPLLSFCITTRDREGLLAETLGNLLAYPGGEIEVVVADASAGDGTEALCSSVAARDPRLRHERLASNGGVDRDYDRSVALARGEYCWMFSDDDLLRPGAVERVLRELPRGFGAVVVNAEDRDREMALLLRERRLPFREDRVYREGEDEGAFRDLCHHLSFIPCLVVRRDLWLSRERERYFGSWFAHVGMLFGAPLPGGFLAVAEPLVSVRNGNVSWGPRSFEIWMFRWPALVWSLDRFPPEARGAVTAAAPWRSPANLLVYRAMGSYGPAEYRRLLAPAAPPGAARLAARAIAALPPLLVNLALAAFCLLLGERGRIPRYNLGNRRRGAGS